MTKKIPVQAYSRVTGYIRPVNTWNPGKIQEWNDRKFFEVKDGTNKHI